MKTLKAIIIDDESDSIDILKLMLERLQSVEVVETCTSANDGIEAIQRHNPDMIFLDIEMPGKDGFEVLKAFPEAEYKVIIVTGYEQYALRAIKFSAIDYLLKPFDTDELKLAIEKVNFALESADPRLEHFTEMMEQRSLPLNKIILPSNRGFRTISFSDIICLESRSGNYCVFRLSDNSTTMVTRPLYHYEELLPWPQFYRIHRSHIVNLEKIKSFDNKSGELILDHDNSLEVSHRRRKDFFKAYKDFVK